MADLWMDVDTALSEVPVNLMPLIDDTDFKTIEDAIAYNAAGLSLVWHFVTTGGVYNNGVAVTPTTGDIYDWTDHGTHGIYTIEIPASGGNSINNDTEGFGWFTGKATGVLPWRGPVIGFRPAAINNSLVNGSDTLQVDLTQVNGSATVATNFEKAASTIIRGTVAAGSTTSVINTSDLTEITNDHYKDRWLIFVTGVAAGQGKQITGYNGTTKALTTGVFQDAPSTSDTFVIV
jgi:hypothetical protein